MELIFVIFTVAMMASSIEMAPSEEFEKKLTLLEFKMEYMEKKIEEMDKSDNELKKKIEEMKSSEEEMTENMIKMKKEILGVFMDSFAVYTTDDDGQTRFFRKFSSILWKAALDRPPLSLEAVRQVQDGTISARGIDNDCCKNLTIEINDVNDRLDHFNERLNDNTLNIVDNQLEIQTNKKQTDTNTDNIDSNANEIDSNTHDIATNRKQTDTNTDNIGSNANEIDSNTHDIATNRETIDTLTETTSRFVSYCGFRQAGHFTGKLTYEKLATNTNTFPAGGLDAKTGVFTAPTQGTYLVTAHYYIARSDKTKYVYVNLNGKNLDYGRIQTYTGADSAGTAITIQMSHSDTLYLNGGGNFYYEDITFCITLIK